MADFPDADPAAISDLADALKAVSVSAADVGLETGGVRGSVMGSEQWRGSASEQWYTVVTGRIGDAELTSEVMGGAAGMLADLASDLESERRVYDRLSGELYTPHPVQGVASRLTGPAEVVNPDVRRAMDRCAARAAELLEDAARRLLRYAALAEDIRAVPVAGRDPGVPAGTDRRAASLQLLATLFGSVAGNRASGSKFEQAVLQALGIAKNTETWRPDSPFEGKLTASGLARGTIVDGQGDNFLVEIKETKELEFRYQLRLQTLMAQKESIPWWIIKAGPGNADPSAVKVAAEESGGGVLYTSDNGKTFTDGKGNPVQVSYDKSSDRLDVNGYQSSIPKTPSGDLGSVPSPDPDAPAGPVAPDVAEAPPTAVTPDMPDAPDMPEPPEFLDIPDIIP